MKLWPWRREKRETGQGYEASLLAAFEASAAGPATAGATAALEAASGLIARCLASGKVDGAPDGAVTPAVLAQVGRSLVRSGESVWSINVDPDGRVRLAVAGHHDVYGAADPAGWTYRVSEYGPSSTLSRMLPAAAVLHVRYLADPVRPWAGVGPLQAATIAGRLSAETAAALADAEGGPRGSLLPLPGADDKEDESIAALKTDIRTLRGRVAFVESTASMNPGAPSSAPKGDWETKRVGADPPAGEVKLLERSFVEVLSACGVPAALFETGDGTAAREAFRRFLHSTLQPLGDLIALELSAKLEADVAVNLDRLFAADLAGRARAFQSMVGAGMDPGKAAGLAGLMESDG